MEEPPLIKLRQHLLPQHLDGLLINKEANVAYLSGFRGEGSLLITAKSKFLIVDFRFKEQAQKETYSFQIYQRQSFQPIEASLSSLIHKLRIKRLGFEAASTSYQFYTKLKSILPKTKIVPVFNMVEPLRAIKNRREIKLLKQAACLAAQTFAFAQRIIQPGKQELEIARRLEYFMKKHGAENSAFEIIVASGQRSSMPHAATSQKKIQRNEAVLVDLGCRIAGYNSDLTRMVFLGKIRGKIKHLYDVVLQAQQLAIKAIRVGITAGQLDQIARQHLAKEGLSSYFGHALGHGIGREVHEHPSISPGNQEVLKEGMVFTIEPAAYLPGVGGVRIEDMVLVTQNGCEVLTKEYR